MSADRGPMPASRRRLVAVCVIVALALAALAAWYGWSLASAQRHAVASFSRTATAQEADDVEEEESSQSRVTTTPNLMVLLGMNENDALVALARGASVRQETTFAAPVDGVVSEAVVVLTTEYAPAFSEQPTVVLGMDGERRVLRAQYAASMASLGYGSLSFSDAVENVGVIGQTLAAAGLAGVGPLQLPTDPTTYSTYASDGRTQVAQSASFSGEQPVDGRLIAWEGSLVYDYAQANETGNLAHTQRLVTISVASA